MLSDWKREYYPETAEQAARDGVETALQHALRKWQGLRPENLAKHGVWVYCDTEITDGIYSLPIDATTCALCVLYYVPACRNCPLYQTRGMACHEPRRQSPYGQWLRACYPEPMIELIERAIANAAAGCHGSGGTGGVSGLRPGSPLIRRR